MRYTLNYVNEVDNRTTNYDREFYTLAEIEALVRHKHVAFTSYQVIVTRPLIEIK